MITSPQNPKLKHIRQLNTSKQYRKTHRQFVFENERWIKEALQNQSHHIDYLVCTQAHSNLLQLANSLHIKTYTCDDRCAQSIAHAKHAAGCFLVLGQPTFNLPASTQHMALGLYNIQNPANLGTILRNAHAFNCAVVYCIGQCCDMYHPESVKAAAGYLFDVSVINVSSLADLVDYTCWLLDSNATTPIQDVDSSTSTCFILGSEIGFNDLDLTGLNRCKIPLANNVDSLNVATTSGIVLYTKYQAR